MKRYLVLLAIAFCGAMPFGAAAQDEEAKTVEVAAKDIKLQIPADWKVGKPSSNMRAAEFQIPAAKSGEDGAELVVYYFGNSTGGTKANVQRWIDQFHEEERKHVIKSGTCKLGRYAVVDISGTYKKPDGPPMLQKTIDTPGSRVIGVVLITEVDANDEYYFLKLAGPDALVASLAQALRAAIGGELSSEKAAELDDLED